MDEEYLIPEEVAKKLRVTPEAVQGWCRSGRLKADRIGRLWRIKPAALQEFIANKGELPEQNPKVSGLGAFAH